MGVVKTVVVLGVGGKVMVAYRVEKLSLVVDIV